MQKKFNHRTQICGVRTGQTQDHTGTRRSHQFQGGAFGPDYRGGSGEFDEARGHSGCGTSDRSRPQSPLQIVVVEFESRRGWIESVCASQSNGCFPDVFRNPLTPLARRAPGAQPPGHGLELKMDIMSRERRCRCHSSPPTLAGTENRVTHVCRSITKILERFPDQSELVRLTHAQLAELGRPVCKHWQEN